MAELFNDKNVDEVVHKRPLIVSWSREGASGPSGLMLVILDDGSTYVYSTFYKYRDEEPIHHIVESVPEFKTLMNIGKEENLKRNPFKDEMCLAYLGLGNIAYIDHKLFDRFLNHDGNGKFTIFKDLIKQYSKEDLWDIAKQVREHFHGIIF